MSAATEPHASLYRRYMADPQPVLDALGTALGWAGEYDDPVITSEQLKAGVLAVLDTLLAPTATEDPS